MSPGDVVRTARAVWPLVKSAVFSGRLFSPPCELTQPDPDILCEYGVEVPIGDGIVLTANVFRSRRARKDARRVPVVMCAHPYNNRLIPALGTTPLRGPPKQYRVIPQVGRPRFSTLTSWEAPDPNFWVPAGYAVVDLNLPGFGTSTGPPTLFTDQQAKSYYEAIEWVARQSWCNGRVGLNGVSYLAISQYHVAACQHYGGPPPSLKCICPWEGLSDVYRELACAGGIEDVAFGPFWWALEVKPSLNAPAPEFVKHNGGLPLDFLRQHPFYDAFWREKTAKLDQITVPMLVCASFSDHAFHTEGSFRAFEKAKSAHKWVYTHRTGKWAAFYSPEVQQFTKDFMDCFLKEDAPRAFLKRAPVRLEVRSSRDVVHEVRDEWEWPLARTDYAKLYLSGADGTLDRHPPQTAHTVEHSAKRGRSTFVMRFDKGVELTGYMKLNIWVQAKAERSAPPPDDMAIFVAVNKLDAQGRKVDFEGMAGNHRDSVTRGYCRVSRRELDTEESTEYHPVLAGTSHLPLKPNEIVAVAIALYPSSTFFAAGESLELIISSSEIIPSPPYIKDVSVNSGTHVVHCGGAFDSYLLIPLVS